MWSTALSFEERPTPQEKIYACEYKLSQELMVEEFMVQMEEHITICSPYVSINIFMSTHIGIALILDLMGYTYNKKKKEDMELEKVD